MISQLNIRQIVEEREERLSPYAAKSRHSQGRLKPEEPCLIRPVFQRDRDRIIHCKSFRRLKHKTQVFIAPSGDHYITRLTHTLEVAQIGRTISRALNLNEDLTEAIALGHDLGHTPFGHIGEQVLNELYHEGFRHNEQSLRIVDVLENEGRGLNLTWEVRDGILNHSKGRGEVFGEGWEKCGTLEADACKIADIIAYVNHDIQDAMRAGVLSENDMPQAALSILGFSHSQRINTMVSDIIEYSWPVTGYNSISTPSIGMSREVREATSLLRDFLFERVYSMHFARNEAQQARQMINQLYSYFKSHPGKLPPEYHLFSDDPERRVVDYIAGMTDRYASWLAGELA